MKLSAPKPLLGEFGALLEKHDIAPVIMDLSGPAWILEALKPMSDAVAAECSPNVETVVIHDLDVEQLRRHVEHGSVQNWKDRRRDMYEIVIKNGDETYKI